MNYLLMNRLCQKLSQRIGVVNNIKSCLPYKQRILYYNAMIKPIFSYASEVWQMLCSKDSLKRIMSLQKRAAWIILDADSRASSVRLFNRLHWLPYYKETMIKQCSIHFKRIQHEVPEHLMVSMKLNSSVHSRKNRFLNCNFISPRYNRITESGRSFAVTATQYWNSLPVERKQQSSLNAFKSVLCNKFFNEQLFLSHFNP